MGGKFEADDVFAVGTQRPCDDKVNLRVDLVDRELVNVDVFRSSFQRAASLRFGVGFVDVFTGAGAIHTDEGERQIEDGRVHICGHLLDVSVWRKPDLDSGIRFPSQFARASFALCHHHLGRFQLAGAT